MLFFKRLASAASPQAPNIDKKRFSARNHPSGPERGLAVLPNELIPTVLTRLDSRSLFRIAQVSRRFNELSTRAWLGRRGITPSQLSSGHVVILSHRPTELGSLLSSFSPPLPRIELFFGDDLISQAKTMKSTARTLTKFASNIAADCPTTVFILQDGLFTCRPDSLRRWSPATGQYEGGWVAATYSHVRMHDGTRQRAPTIRALRTLSLKYPLHPSSAPFDKWRLVVVDAASLTDLQLSIKLAPQEWAAILDALALPALVCVGIWAEAISTATSTRFFNRHAGIRTIKYMSTTADALPAHCVPLSLPRLESLNTRAPYLVHIFTPPGVAHSLSCADANSPPEPESSSTRARFPHLVHIELRPHAQFAAALLLASLHPPLAALTLWSLLPSHFTPITSWPIFPNIRRVTINESRIPLLLGADFP
ncbi:hypothetical protein MSAN_00960100 [Mycena sanguinolenta]|uniref:F-box domain-containing protein n=1 Tax=Mycena sanguinolenta TaxID=230812 RepID=A0A8H6Z093_9AGAR|nr:hypothetical protein MSAN_00960100 [Mycena sanguinolenta]